jgi:hypothetical protein
MFRVGNGPALVGELKVPAVVKFDGASCWGNGVLTSASGIEKELVPLSGVVSLRELD